MTSGRCSGVGEEVGSLRVGEGVAQFLPQRGYPLPRSSVQPGFLPFPVNPLTLAERFGQSEGRAIKLSISAQSGT